MPPLGQQEADQIVVLGGRVDRGTHDTLRSGGVSGSAQRQFIRDLQNGRIPHQPPVLYPVTMTDSAPNPIVLLRGKGSTLPDD